MRSFLVRGLEWVLLLLGLLAAPAATRAQQTARPESLVALRQRLVALPDSQQLWPYVDWAWAQEQAGHRSAADSALRLALAVSRRPGVPPRQQAHFAETQGFVAKQRGLLLDALAYYQPALAYYQRTHYYAQEASLLIRLAEVHSSSQPPNLPQAEAYLRQALRVAQAHNLAAAEANAWRGLSVTAEESGQPARALTYNDRALHAYARTPDATGRNAARITRGILLTTLGRRPEAVRLLRLALDTARRVQPTQVNYAHLALAEALLPLGQPDAAEVHLRPVLADAARRHDLPQLQRGYELLAQAQAGQHHFAAALASQLQSAAYVDSLRRSEQRQQLLAAETRYQTRAKQARIALLATSNRRLDQANTRQRRLLGALAGGVALLLALLTVVLSQRRRLGRANTQLAATNRTVNEQAQRLTTLLQELHHRVKNNLATVASLLRLHGNRLTDAAALQALQESRQRVEAMSLIHQRLYQTSEVTRVDMAAYLADLTDSLLQAYGYAPHQVELDLVVQVPTLDVDVAVPLGLIVNELLTNAFKHAYAQVPRPWLRLHLHPGAAVLVLEVADNGPGFGLLPPGPRSFGRRLIAVLSEQLGAEAEECDAPGACFRLRIPATA